MQSLSVSPFAARTSRPHSGHMPTILRERGRDKAEAIHLTKTPAGMSEWLRENYGYEVSRKVIIMWIRRGKLPSSKPVEDGYYEFSIREIVSMAMAYSSRQ